MEILLTLFIFGQTYADTTWIMYGATLENTHFQKMVGAMDVEPNVKWLYGTTGSVEFYGAAVADVDGIAGMEVVIGSNDNKVYCLDGVTGNVKWSYITGDVVYSSPSIANIDGIAGMEVVIGSNDNKVYCLDGVTGNVKWSYITSGNVWSSPAVADVNGNGTIEVVIGNHDNKVYCLDGVTGVMEWSYTTGDNVESSSAVADMDGDGNIEVVIGSKDGKVYCLDGVTGLVEWSYDAGGDIHRGISVADIDGEVLGECKLEVLIPNLSCDYLTCLNGENGSVLWTKQLASDVHDITIADIDNDGCVEIVVGTAVGNKIWALDDVGNRSNCKCVPSSTEENNTEIFRQNGIEFRSMGKGIYLFTPNAIQVDINVYDISGSLEQIIYKGVLNKGGHTFMPNIKSSGVYFVALQNHNFKKSLKLIRF